MLESSTHVPTRPGDPRRTPEQDDAPIGDLDTARLRNMVAKRVFGEQLDPIRIGRYPVLRRIGQGGMGVVYAGYDNELDRRIAIKLLRRGDTRDELEAERMRARLLREARTLAQLSSPRIVQIYEVGEHDGQVFLAMEFVAGETLRQWLESAPRSLAEIVAVFSEAGRGLAAAHAAGLVHRDFKPENAIVVADAGAIVRVRVLDFGVATTSRELARDDELPARSAANDDVRLTATGALLGTPAYMSPEQFAGRPTDARSDQFSFAVALFEALFGARPFPGETLQAVVTATLAGAVVVPSGRRVPPRVLQALRRALARDPSDRFASMDALLRALDLRARRWRWMGAGAALAIAGVGWLGVRAGELSEQVTAASERADDAESQLRERELAIVLGELSLALFEDPTLGIERLAALPDDADAWASDAWRTVARAEELGVADRILPMPEGWVRGGLIDERTALLQGPFTAALWDLDNGELDVLTTEAEHEVDVSPGGRWVVAVVGDELRIIDVASRVEQTWWLTGCEPAELASDEPMLALDCPTGPPRSLAWSAPASDRPGLTIHEAPPLAFERPLRSWQWFARNPDAMRRASRPPGSHFMFARADTMSAGTRGSSTAAGVEPLLLWRDGVDEPTRIALELTPQSAAFSPSEATLAVGTVDGAIWLVDVSAAGGPPERFAKLDAGQLEGLRFSRDERGLCGTTRDGSVVVWDLADRQEVQRIRGLADASGCFWHADGSFSVFGSNELRHYPAPPLRRMASEIRAVADAGEHTAVLTRDGALDVIGAGTAKRLRVGPESSELALAPGGTRVALAGKQRVTVLDVASGKELLSAPTRDQCAAALRFVGSDDVFMWVDANAIHIRTVADGREVLVPVPSEGYWRAITVDGPHILAAFGELDAEHDELLTIARTGEILTRVELPTLAGSNIEVLAGDRLAYTDREQALIIVGRDGVLHRRLRDEGSAVLDLRALADGRGLVSVDVRDVIEIWDTETGQCHELAIARGHGSVVREGAHRLHHDASLALDDAGSLWSVDRTGELARYELRVPWPGSELAPWVQGRVQRTPPRWDALVAAWTK